MQPKIGIIYLTFATPHWQADIDRGLSSLTKMTYPKDRVELICVESVSPTGEIVEPWFRQEWLSKSGRELPSVTYIRNERVVGFAENNNIGFKKAKELGCEYIYLLNEDAEVKSDFLERAVERIQSDETIAYVQSLILLGDHERVNTIGNAYHFLGFGYSNGYRWSKEQALSVLEDEKKKNPQLEIGYLSGAGVLGSILLIDRCGLFDEGFFMYHEDTDAAFQARIRGYKIVIEPSSIIYHHYDFSKSISKYYLMEKNRWAMVFSYYHWWTIGAILPMFVAMELGLLFFSLVRGWWPEKIKVYREVLSPAFWRWIRHRRKIIQSERTLSDRDLLKYMVATVDFQEEQVKNPVLTYLGNPVMKAYFWLLRKVVV